MVHFQDQTFRHSHQVMLLIQVAENLLQETINRQAVVQVRLAVLLVLVVQALVVQAAHLAVSMWMSITQ